MQKDTTRKKIKIVEKNMIGIKVEKKKIFKTTREFSFTNPIEKRVSMQYSSCTKKKYEKEKNRQNKNKKFFNFQ